jgi:hypothetical protein
MQEKEWTVNPEIISFAKGLRAIFYLN